MEDQEIYRANVLVEFDQESHVYRVHGRVIPSVTQIIKELIGYAYYADEWYLQRGRAVHACAALIAQGRNFKHDPQIAGQVKALRNFFDEVKPNIIFLEQPMASTVFRFAGTPDLIAEINGSQYIIDYKASIDIDRLALQLGGYRKLLEDHTGMKVHYGLGVEIKDDGRYKLTEKINLIPAEREFLAMRAVYGIKERLNILTEGK